MTVDDVISEMSRKSADTTDEDETTEPTGTKGFLNSMKERVVAVTKSGRSVRKPNRCTMPYDKASKNSDDKKL